MTLTSPVDVFCSPATPMSTPVSSTAITMPRPSMSELALRYASTWQVDSESCVHGSSVWAVSAVVMHNNTRAGSAKRCMKDLPTLAGCE